MSPKGGYDGGNLGELATKSVGRGGGDNEVITAGDGGLMNMDIGIIIHACGMYACTWGLGGHMGMGTCGYIVFRWLGRARIINSCATR